MTVTITTASLTLSEGLRGPLIQFDDARPLAPEAVDAWWKKTRRELVKKLRAWAAHPPAPTPFDRTKGDLYLRMPLPIGLLDDVDCDLVSELLPEIEEHVLMNVRHAAGEHGACPRTARCRGDE